MKTRILAFLLAAMMVMGLGVLAVSAADCDSAITVSVDQVEVEVGETTATVGIWITDLQDEDDLGAIDIKVKYDDTKLQQTDVYAETGSGRNKVYYGAACFEGGYQFSEPGSETNPLTFLAWTTTKTNPGYDSSYEMNTYEFAFIDFEILGDWEGRTPLEITFVDALRRSDDAHFANVTTVNGYIQRGEYNEEPPVTNTLFVTGPANVAINGEGTDVTAETGFAPANGDKVTLTAGEGFQYWANAETGAAVSYAPVFSFIVDSTTTLKLAAVYEDESVDTVLVTFKDALSGKIHATKEVAKDSALDAATFPAHTPILGYKAHTYSVAEGETFVEAAGYVVSEDTVVLLSYTKDNTVTKGLTVNDGTNTFNYTRSFGAIATVYANVENFSYWTDGEGTILSLSPIYKFSMPNEDVVLTAVSGAAAPEAVLATISNELSGGNIVTTFSRDLAEGATLVEAGVLYTRKGTAADLVVDVTSPFVTKGVSTATDSTYGFIKNVEGKAGTWLIKGYMTYEVGGVATTIYTALETIVVA